MRPHSHSSLKKGIVDKSDQQKGILQMRKEKVVSEEACGRCDLFFFCSFPNLVSTMPGYSKARKKPQRVPFLQTRVLLTGSPGPRLLPPFSSSLSFSLSFSLSLYLLLFFFRLLTYSVILCVFTISVHKVELF